MCVCTPEIKTPFCGKRGCEEPPPKPRMYVTDNGEEKRDRRRKDRSNEDPRIDHLFNGFDNMIANADEYSAGYLKSMRQEFGQIIASLDR